MSVMTFISIQFYTWLISRYHYRHQCFFTTTSELYRHECLVYKWSISRLANKLNWVLRILWKPHICLLLENENENSLQLKCIKVADWSQCIVLVNGENENLSNGVVRVLKALWIFWSETINFLRKLHKTNIFGMPPKILPKSYVHSSL